MLITKEAIDKYEMTIGIECHVQLKTKSKLFSAAGNDARDVEANTLVSPIDYGMPGVLPVLNKEAVELAIRVGHALNAEVAEFSKFDRKHYFYPDLPNGYQITQFDQPTVGKGEIEVPIGEKGETFKVGITRAHIEADAGKSTHPAGKDYTLVDLNRVGTPLVEIVSEPDIHSAAQARAYAQELYYLMKYADVSYANLFHGNMRFDVNVSIARKGSEELGTRAEVKNLNSFRSVEKAAEYELRRQVELLEKGEKIVQETRGWDDAKMKTFSQRGKENAHDYRYFPDPDLPPIVLDKKHIDEVAKQMGPLPPEIRDKLAEINLQITQINTLMDSEQLIAIQLEVFNTQDEKVAKRVANWLVGPVQAIVTSGEFNWDSFKLSAKDLVDVAGLVAESKLNSTAAKEVIEALIYSGDKSAEEVAKERNLIQESDESAVEAIVKDVLGQNKAAASDVQNGEMKAIGFLVGQIMKQSKGQANPQVATKLIKKILGV